MEKSTITIELFTQGDGNVVATIGEMEGTITSAHMMSASYAAAAAIAAIESRQVNDVLMDLIELTQHVKTMSEMPSSN